MALALPTLSVSGNKAEVSGMVQFRWLVHEQMENDAEQALTGDAAEEEASGFYLRRARLYFHFSNTDYNLEGLIHIRFEDPVTLYH